MALATIAVVSMAVGAVAQMYNSEKARGASKARLKEIEAMYDKIIPPNYDLSITDPPRMHQERLKMPQFSSNNGMPKWDMKKLEPNQFKLLAKFDPKIAQMVTEQAPQMIEQTEDMKMGRAAEKKALRRFTQVGEGGFDPVYQQRVKQARDRAQSEAQSRSASIMQDFARRGMGGSGMELAAKMGASSTAMDRNAQMGMQAESQAYQNQMQALSQGAALGGRMQDRETSLQSKNAQIANDFNQRMSKRHQDWEMMRADQLNQADLRNMQEAQRISDQNTQTRNQYDQRHQGRMDNIAMKNYQAKMDELNRQDALKKWQYGAEGAERSRIDQQNVMTAEWRRNEKRYGNTMKAQAYQDQMAKAAGRAGVGFQMNQLGQQSARDQNSAIQGMANMGMMYGMNQQQQPPQRRFGETSSFGYGDNSYNPYRSTS